MKYKICILIIFSFFSLTISAQYLENDPTPMQRVFFGGNIGLSFGSYTYIAVNPIIGYRLTNRLSAGTGFNYSYAKYDYYNYKGNMYGANVFASFTIIKNISEIVPLYSNSGILLYGEYSGMNISDYYILPEGATKWVYSPLAGIAFQSPIGPKSYAILMILFNFNETRYSPFPNPIFRASVQF